MKLCRFEAPGLGDPRVGVVLGAEIADVTETVAEALPAARWPLPPGDMLIAALGDLAPRLEAAEKGAPRVKRTAVRLLSPVANPGKVVAAPVNYAKHLDESRADKGINQGDEVRPIDKYRLFLKATSSVVGCDEGVEVRMPDRRTDHEVELALVIGRGGRDIAEGDALGHVAGWMIGLDMTIRGTEDRSYRKSLDTFTVLGPWLVTPDEFGPPAPKALSLNVGDEPRQAANTRDLIWPVEKIISVASHAYTLHPGDVILTGTPEGVGPVAPGDAIHAEIEGIGAMRVDVRA